MSWPQPKPTYLHRKPLSWPTHIPTTIVDFTTQILLQVTSK